MDQSSPIADSFEAPVPATARVLGGPALSLVSSRFQLAQPADPAPDPWREGVAQLLAWLGVETGFLTPARPSGRLARMADWAANASQLADPAPIFAPWIGWSPSAFQHGGLTGLPQAQYVVSYLIDHARGAPAARGGTDIVLISPHRAPPCCGQ